MAAILGFIIGCMIGGLVGFAIATILYVVKEDDKDGEGQK